MRSKFQTTQFEINTQFEVCYWTDLTLTADKYLLNDESEMYVGPTADSLLSKHYHCSYCVRLSQVAQRTSQSRGSDDTEHVLLHSIRQVNVFVFQILQDQFYNSKKMQLPRINF